MNWSDIFHYSDGVLRWRENQKRIKAGTIAWNVNQSGYIRIKYRGEKFLAHRIVWEMHYGKIPEGMQVDHINHDRTDNRIENLRLVNANENGKNQKSSTRNKSGVVGVSWKSQKNKWHAQIMVDGKQIHLGFYDDINDAKDARKVAERKYGFHENHGK